MQVGGLLDNDSTILAIVPCGGREVAHKSGGFIRGFDNDQRSGINEYSVMDDR
jgi:hypothetical protein